MTDRDAKPRAIWLRSFYGFNPEDDGYIGWTEEAHRNRMLSLMEDGDIFMIYGAASSETSKAHRHCVLGFLQVNPKPIRDVEKASTIGMRRKRERGWQDKWTYAMPVVRAWRADENILLERIAPKTYRPESGRSIAVWSAPLEPEEVGRALKIKVAEVNVFGERHLENHDSRLDFFAQVFQPSRAFPSSFGQRTADYIDGATWLYLARFDGDGLALRGLPRRLLDKSVLLKIGVSNNLERRASELNAGFPPAAIGKWLMQLKSEPYDDHRKAEAAEQKFKHEAQNKLESLGGEFFQGDWTQAQSIFASIPGVSRFGG